MTLVFFQVKVISDLYQVQHLPENVLYALRNKNDMIAPLSDNISLFSEEWIKCQNQAFNFIRSSLIHPTTKIFDLWQETQSHEETKKIQKKKRQDEVINDLIL